MNLLEKIFNLDQQNEHLLIKILGIKIKIKQKTDLLNQIKPAKRFNYLRLELSNNCGYKCVCCPREKMTRKIGYMQDNDFKIIAQNFEDKTQIKRVDLHGYGEPLLVKDIIHKVNIAHENFPEARLFIATTLGYNMPDDFWENLIKSPLTDITVSFYGGNKENYKNVHRVDNFDIAYKNLKKLVSINKRYNNKLNIIVQFNKHNKIENVNLPNNAELTEKLKNELIELGLDEKNIQYLVLHNFGDGRQYVQQGVHAKVCSVVLSNTFYSAVMQVSWNLNVIPCCMIYNDDIVFGNLKKQSVNKIFKGSKYKKFVKAVRKHLYDDYPQCQNCTLR